MIDASNNTELRVYILNLDTSKDRLYGASMQLAAAKLPFERVPGVDGANLTAEDIEGYDPAMGLKRYGRLLQSGQIGCALGHRRALEQFVQSGVACGLVLEDDHACEPSICSMIETVVSIISQPRFGGWQVVNFSHDLARYKTELAVIDDAGTMRHVYAAHDFPARSTGVLWTREGAKAFLSHTRRIYAPFDLMLQDFCADQGGGYILSPFPVPTRNIDSDILSVNEASEVTGNDICQGIAPLGRVREFLRIERRNIKLRSKTMKNRKAFRRHMNDAKFG